MTYQSRTARLLAVTAAISLAVSACGLGADDSQDAATESTPVDEAASTAPAPEPEPEPELDTAPIEPEPQDEEPAPADPDDADDAPPPDDEQDVARPQDAAPLARVEGSPPFSLLEIRDLRRDGDTVTVEFAISVEEDSGSTGTSDVFAGGPDMFGSLSTEGEASAGDARRRSVSGVTLVDRANANRHLVLRDSAGYCLCTRFDGLVTGGERYIHSAQFPAPPSDVTEMTVEVPLFPSIDNVPLREAA